MSVSWRVEAWVDGLAHLTATSADVVAPPDPGELLLVAPFRITETIDDQLWPAQPRTYASFTVLANTAAELVGPKRGDRACVGFKTPSSAAGVGQPWDWRLAGVVDTYKLRPSDGHGVVAEVTMVDYRIGRLATRDAGTSAYAQESAQTRLYSILGAFQVSTPTPWDGATDPNQAARPAGRASSMELVDRVLRSWADVDGAGNALGRPVISPQLSGSAYDIEGVEIVQNITTGDDTWLLTRQDKVLSLSDIVEVPAGLCALDALTWDSPGDQVPTVVSVQWLNSGTQTTNRGTTGDVRYREVTAAIDTDLIASAPANRCVDLYLPDAGASDWQADTFAYYIGREAVDGPRLPRLGSLVQLTDLAADLSPDGLTSYSGQLIAVDLTLVDGELVVLLTTLPAVGAQAYDGGDATTSSAVAFDGGDATTTFANTLDGGTA